MKIKVFIISIIALITIGAWMFFLKINPLEDIKEATNQKSNILDVETILPPESWDKSLIGTWNFAIKIWSRTALRLVSGEVEYKEDGSFIKHISYEFYDPRGIGATIDMSKIDENRYQGHTGGRVIGSWELDLNARVWLESATINNCNIEPLGVLYDPCKKDFGEKVIYGTHSTEYAKYSLKKFTSQIIWIKENNYKTAEEINIVFKKQ